MKRDLDLIRNLLLAIESSNDIPVHTNQLANLCDNQNILDYHVHLLYEAGFIEALETNIIGSYFPKYRILWLSNTGHDYLDSVRSTSVWGKVKSCLNNVGGNISLNVAQEIAEKLVTQYLTNQLLP